MKGKICLVTGATAGIGKETARELARRGATVIAVARDRAKGEAVVAEIRRDARNEDVHLLLCDLSSQVEVRRLAAEFRAKYDRLHLLVNNAGAVFGKRQVTVDGIEATFATNHLAYYLLTDLLLDLLKASAPARIVNVASDAHRGTKLDFDDLGFERRSYSEFTVYGASKLANIVWSAELAKRLEGTGVTSNSLHPGVVATNFGATSGSGFMRFGLKIVRPFLLTAEKGAETTIYLATSLEVEGVTGKYFSKKKAIEPDAAARAPGLGERLFTVSASLVAKSASAAAA